MSETFVPSRISVIMPCYNAAAFVEEAVNCVMNQTYPDVELVVVDDGSTDGSANILQELTARYAPRIQLHFQDRQGPFPARNIALRNAHGGYVAFLDADDYWTLDALEKLAASLNAQSADVAYCGWQNVGDRYRSLHPAGLQPDGYGGGISAYLPLAHPCSIGTPGSH